ncbi:hypothetical protein VZO05_10915 [Aggregatilineales bacterium SYSU G02658]
MSVLSALSLWLLPLMVAALLYTNGVALPFFSDDVETQRFVQPRTLLELWTQVEVNGAYYRPLANLLYRALPLDAALWHGLLLWLHLLTVALVGALARALIGRRAVFSAMLLYAAFPFHAQSVLWAGSIGHVLMVSLIVAACVGALTDRPRLALLSGVAAPFAHESGVTTAALVGLALWAQGGACGVRQRWRLLAALAGAALIYWLLRSFFVGGGSLRLDFDALAFNAAYLGQGLSLPAQWIAGALGGDPVARALGALAAFCALLIAALGRQRLLWAGLGWVGVGLAPAWLLLHPNYVLYGDRLLTIAAPAIVLLWAAALHKLPRGLGTLALVALTLGSVGMAQSVIAQHRLHADALRPVIATADPAVPTLYLNLPAHTEQIASPLPLWRASAGLLTDWIELRDFLWLNAAQREFPRVGYAHAPWLADAPPDLLTRFYGGSLSPAELPSLIQQHARTIRTRWTGTGWQAFEWARQLDRASGVMFDESIILHAEAALTGDAVRVALDWQRIAAPSADWTAFVHLLCDGQIVAQADGDPFAGSLPLSAWKDGEAWREVRWLTLPTSADRGCLRVAVGLYDRATLERARSDVGDALDAPMR